MLRGLVVTDRAKIEEEESIARASMAEVGIVSLEKLRDRIQASSEENVDPHLLTEVSSRIIGTLRKRTYTNDEKVRALEEEQLERRFRLTALRAERGELYHLRATRAISNDTLQKMLYDLDLLEALLIDKQH
ncbi:Na+/H+ antiporter [Budvicia aquatica]|uniref:Na+/H+ antiporter n=1 Tax=Budvicia aquatica TaxID=82979 RepID=A0A484ZAM7_9GAMM|nr:Na+/H+ antiporter [Budvicia aquatica]